MFIPSNYYLYMINKYITKTKIFNFLKKYKRTLAKNIVEEPHIRKQNIKPENLYLQITSSLSKLEKGNDKYQQILDTYKTHEINDKPILDMVNCNEDQLTKIINDEISEEEHGDEKEIRFKRPPHSKKELADVFEQAEGIYEEHRHILLANDKEIQSERTNAFLERIPKYFNIRRLINPVTHSEIFLVGVQRDSSLHSHFLANLLAKISPEAIAVQLPPDHPMFINTYSSITKEWQEFIKKNTDCNFLVNPLPKDLVDIIFTKTKLEKLYCINFSNNEDVILAHDMVFTRQSKI
jgi:hypothetical protein